MYKDLSAAQLAETFDVLRELPHATANLSALDEATVAFADRFPDVAAARHPFTVARYKHQIGDPGDTWAAVLVAGDRLAATLRALGELRIARCQAPTAYGDTCRLALDDTGQCPYPTRHVAPPEQ